MYANYEALSCIPEPYDELWVLGDLVDYGPSPREVIDFVQSRATVVVRGNHDHAVAFGENPRCSPDFREMASATVAYTKSVLPPEDLEYLSKLPETARVSAPPGCSDRSFSPFFSRSAIRHRRSSGGAAEERQGILLSQLLAMALETDPRNLRGQMPNSPPTH